MLAAAPPPADSEYDVICVGGGLGGLAAAIRAHDLGARVLILERSAMVGGVAAYSGGWCWVAGSQSGTDTIEAAEQYLDQVQGADRPVDRKARRDYLLSAVRATRWFTAAGVPLSLVRSAPDLYHPCPGSTAQGRLLECIVPGPELGPWRTRLRPSVHYRTGVTRDEIYFTLSSDVTARLALARERQSEDLLTHGLGLAAGFAREALVTRGIRCLLEHRVTALITQHGTEHDSTGHAKITGVVAAGPGGPVRFRATKGVLLAVGGYGNADDAAELEDVPEFIEASPPVVDGDGLGLAQSVGATVVRGADPFVVLGARLEQRTHPGSDVPLYNQLLETIGFPHSIIVNRDGRRFGDESYYGALIRGLRTFDPQHNRWANFPCWLVFDQAFGDRYPLGPYPPGAGYPRAVAKFASLAELAAATGIDAAGLTDTVTRFNQFADAGTDLDFARGSLAFTQRAYGDPRYRNPNLGPVRQAPFYAVPLHVLGVGLCSLGLAIDTDARVLRRDGSVIAGLYATGNAAATRELKGYVTGLANARNYTYAYNAVNDMLGAGE